MITFTDISEAKTLEATLREAQAVLQDRFTDQSLELNTTAHALELVLNKTQTELKKRFASQATELTRARADRRWPMTVSSSPIRRLMAHNAPR